MGDRLSIARPFEAQEVELWGAVYKTRRVTKTVETALDDLIDKHDTAEGRAARVQMLGELFDALLEPADKETEKASVTVVKAWEADDVSSDRLLEFFWQVRHASRPT